MPNYQTKVIQVDAVQVTETLISTKVTELGGTSPATEEFTLTDGRKFKLVYHPYHVTIGTPIGTKIAHIGDWIVTKANGEKFPCKPDLFAETYEEIVL